MISGFSELILSDDDLDEEDIEQLVKTIKENSEHLLVMLNELLDVSKVKSGKIDLKLEECNIGEIIQQEIRYNKVVADKKKMTIEFEEGCHQSIYVDKNKFKQVINNYLSNAIKYSPEGSRIKVSLDCSEGPVHLEVTDQGPGIPQKYLETVFDPFIMAGSKATGGEKSTGLGLAIVKNIVQAHGGTVGVRNKLPPRRPFKKRGL